MVVGERGGGGHDPTADEDEARFSVDVCRLRQEAVRLVSSLFKVGRCGENMNRVANDQAGRGVKSFLLGLSGGQSVVRQ